MPTDQLTTFDKLNQETAKIEWRSLERFFAQGKLMVISPELDLVKTAVLIADNNENDIAPLIEEKTLFFPDMEWVKLNCAADTLVWAVVVAPWVLVQPLVAETP